MRAKIRVLMEAMKLTQEVLLLNFQYKGENYQITHLLLSHSFVILKVQGKGKKEVFDTITYK